MKRILWIVLAVALSTGVYFTIRYGLRPKPIPILNPTEFSNPEQIGAVIYRGLRQNIRQERLVVLGSMPELSVSAEIWNGFLKTAAADKVNIDVFYQWPNVAVPETANKMGLISLTEADIQSGDFANQVRQKLNRGHVVIVHTLTSEASHLVKDSLARRLERMPTGPLLSLSIAPFAVTDAGVEALAEHCNLAKEQDDGDQRLECATYRVSKKFVKKKLEPFKLWAAMERHGLKEYLLFVHQSE
jgi:hypothetical protein